MTSIAKIVCSLRPTRVVKGYVSMPSTLKISFVVKSRWFRASRVRYYIRHPDGGTMEITRQDALVLLALQEIADRADKDERSHAEWCVYRAELERQKAASVK